MAYPVPPVFQQRFTHLPPRSLPAEEELAHATPSPIGRYRSHAFEQIGGAVDLGIQGRGQPP